MRRWSFCASLIKIGPKLWPLECLQGLSDLNFWPIFWPDMTHIQTWDIVKMIILCKFDKDWTKTVASRVFSMCFWFDLLTLFLTQHDPYSNLTEILSSWLFWASLMMIVPKLWPLEFSQGFSMIWPTDLVFDPTWPIFDLFRDIVKMIILRKLDEDGTKTVECSQGFSMIWSTDLVFDPGRPIFEPERDIMKMIILSKFDDEWLKTVASRVFTSQKWTRDARLMMHRCTTTYRDW